MHSRKSIRRASRLHLERFEDRTTPSTFTVTNTNDSGSGSLRQAIINANTSPGFDTIGFSLTISFPGSPGVKTIQPLSQLPSITEAVDINGYAQLGSRPNSVAVGDNSIHLIEINGARAPAGSFGLFVETPVGVTIRGLVINGFQVQIAFDGGTFQTNLVIAGNFLGVNAFGTAAVAGSGSGILTSLGSNDSGVMIGGSRPSDRNVISGHDFAGLDLHGSNGNVQGNYIGTNSQGTAAIPNRIGVSLSSDHSLIGGTGTGAGNLISGNSDRGLSFFSSDAHDNQVIGNLIGSNAANTAPLGNGGAGVDFVFSASNNTIGGTSAGSRNVIAHNGGNGVAVLAKQHTTDPDSVGNRILGNSIFDNGKLGIDLGDDGVTSNDGSELDTGPNNKQNFPAIGAVSNGVQTAINSTLLCLKNQNYRIEFFGNASADPSGFGEGGTFLGFVEVATDGTGIARFTYLHPQRISAGTIITATATDLTTGDTSEFSRPTTVNDSARFIVTNNNDSGAGSLRQAIIDANAHSNVSGLIDTIFFDIPGILLHTIQPPSDLPILSDTVLIDGYTQAGASPNTLSVGTNAVLKIQLVGLRNFNQTGLSLNAANSVVRGLSITGFNSGISVVGDNSTIVGNFIGMNPNGATPNGNANGIVITATGVRIGDASVDSRNLISGNQFNGIFVEGPNAVILGNLIGTDAAGTSAMGNLIGIFVAAAANATIGTSAPGAANVISGSALTGITIVNSSHAHIEGNLIGWNAPATALLGNSGDGVRVLVDGSSGTATGNTITANRIAGNSGLGINLGDDRVTPNDANDSDSGPNNLQNFPDLIKAVSAGTQSVILGSFPFVVNTPTPFRFEFFSSATTNRAGFSEGETLISSQTVILPFSGVFTPSAVVQSNLAGKFVTATVTNLLTGDTSEFSKALQVKEKLYAVSAGPGGPSRFKAFNPDGTLKFDIQAYDPAFTGGIRVATGDVSGDGVDDIITAACAGGGPHVKVFDGVTGNEIASFFAYAPGFIGGVWVAAADFNGDGKADIVTGVGPGGGPHVKVIDATKLARIDLNGTILDSALVTQFFAYEQTFTGGVNVAAADVTGDGRADVITGAGSGGGPRVNVFDGTNFGTLAAFFAYDPSFGGGVFVAAGDINGDGKADVVTGAGPGAAPHVKVINGTKLGQKLANGQIADGGLLSQLFAFDITFAGGVRVATTDTNADGVAELVVGQGNKGSLGTNLVRVLNGLTLAEIRSFQAFDPTFNGGVFVG